MYFGMFDPTIILLLPAIIFAFVAQAKVQRAYGIYAKVRNRKGITGARAARIILDSNGLSGVGIEMTKGRLTDNYDPRKKILRLSPDVYSGASIAAVSIAAHESGHALQHAEKYKPLAIRNTIVPAVNVGSFLSWPLLLIGIVAISAGYYFEGNLVFDIGIIFFICVIIFHTVTLPVEFNASRRAIAQLVGLGIVYDEESGGAKKVLSAAAMTYVAALAMAIANLLRILLIRGRE